MTLGEIMQSKMDDKSCIRVKLVMAALTLVLVCSFSVLREFNTTGYGEIALCVGLLVFSAFIAFAGVFRSSLLQLLWGWSLAVATLALAILCVVVYRGAELVFGLVALFGAVFGSYLLLIDSSVRSFRETLRKRIQDAQQVGAQNP